VARVMIAIIQTGRRGNSHKHLKIVKVRVTGFDGSEGDLSTMESWPGARDDWTLDQFNEGGFNKVSIAIDYVRVYGVQ